MKFFQDSSTDGSGVRNLARHLEYNPRQQAGVKAKYVRSIKARGICESVRGEAWAMQSTEGGPYLLLSCASLTEAFYCAITEEPANENIQATARSGLEMRILSSRTPASICRYLVRLHNRFHGGASTNFLELMAAVPEVERALLQWKTQHGITWQARDYEARCSLT